MYKKHSTPKSTKTYSKTNMHPHIHQIPSTELHKQFPEPIWKSEINRLQKLIAQEMSVRQKYDIDLLNMIRHLQETKKSKIIVKTDANNMSRLFSPNRNGKNSMEDTESISMCKNLLTTIKSQRELQFNKSKSKMQEMEEELKKVYDKLGRFQKIDSTLNYLNQELKCFKVEVVDMQNETAQQIKKLIQSNAQINDQMHQNKDEQQRYLDSMREQGVVCKSSITIIQQQFEKATQKLMELQNLTSQFKIFKNRIGQMQYTSKNHLEQFDRTNSQTNYTLQQMKKQNEVQMNNLKKQLSLGMETQSKNTQSIIQLIDKNIGKQVHQFKIEIQEGELLRDKYIQQIISSLETKLNAKLLGLDGRCLGLKEEMLQKFERSSNFQKRQLQQFKQFKQQTLKIIQDHLANQQNTLGKSTLEVNQKMSDLQSCIRTCMQSLQSVQEHSSSAFEDLEYRIKIASQSIIETKQTIEETFYGSDYRSKERFESQVSLDCTQQSNQPARRVGENMEKMINMENRMSGLQRRMDTLYGQYLGKPIFQK